MRSATAEGGQQRRDLTCYKWLMSAVAACENHPQREAIGVCVQCRTRVCSECSTKVEGINYCVRCLAGLAQEGGRSLAPRHEPRAKSAYFVASGYFALLWLATWTLLQTFLPGG
jgi:hypothetical protein